MKSHPALGAEESRHSFARNSCRAVLAVKGSLRREGRALDRLRAALHTSPLRRNVGSVDWRDERAFAFLRENLQCEDNFPEEQIDE